MKIVINNNINNGINVESGEIININNVSSKQYGANWHANGVATGARQQLMALIMACSALMAQ
jgi:hypothetical protein